jgi:DNA invertase Pin-like site-specific DNA recombinase
MSGAPVRVGIYTRVSTEEQAREGISLDMQEARWGEATWSASRRLEVKEHRQ